MRSSFVTVLNRGARADNSSMDEKTIHAITGLVEALTGLVRILGAWPFVAVLLLGAALFVALPWLREHSRNKRLDLVIEHKEKEIQRLVEDNRRYREVYLTSLGYPM